MSCGTQWHSLIDHLNWVFPEWPLCVLCGPSCCNWVLTAIDPFMCGFYSQACWLWVSTQTTLYELLLRFFFKKYIFIDYAITVVPFPPPTPLHPAHPLPPTFPPYSSCPWDILISSLASTFATLFLPSPCLFSIYHLCYLFSVPFPPSPPPTLLLTTLHVISISMVLFLF